MTLRTAMANDMDAGVERAPGLARIMILVVAYDAESTLAQVLDRIPPDVLAKVEQIVVFDDASRDSTYQVGRQYQAEGHPASAKLRVFRNPVNLMYGGNQQRGYLYALEQGFDIVVLLHGDGQYAPEVMDRLIAPLERGEADLVMGSRMLEPGAARRGNMPLYKFVGNKILTWLENTLAGTRLSEFHSGYRAYRVAALREVPVGRLTTNWHFDTQIILAFVGRGLRIREVAIPTYYGDEICHVNGIPYALHCIWEAVWFAMTTRWRATKGRQRAALSTASRSQE
jgi:glycosyltransferase involved in cell wall biosynthesis